MNTNLTPPDNRESAIVATRFNLASRFSRVINVSANQRLDFDWVGWQASVALLDAVILITLARFHRFAFSFS